MHGPADAVIMHVSLAAALPGLPRGQEGAGLAPTAGVPQPPASGAEELPAPACSGSGQRVRVQEADAAQPGTAAAGAAAEGLCGEGGARWAARPSEDAEDSGGAETGADALRWLDAVVREVGALPGAREVRFTPCCRLHDVF